MLESLGRRFHRWILWHLHQGKGRQCMPTSRIRPVEGLEPLEGREARHRGRAQRAACSSGTSPPSTLRHGRGGPSGSSRSGSQGHREEVGWPRSRRKWPQNKGEPGPPQLEGAGKAAASGARGAGLRAAGVTTLPDARLQAGSRGSGSKGCRDPGPAFYPLCNQPCLRCSTSRGLSFLLWKMRW